jgi:cell division protein FtsA
MAVGDIIAGLDLGTTKVTAIVAEQTEDGLDIIGVGSVPARGLKRGVVVNIEATVQAIKAAVEQAESMAGVRINSVFAGIAGSHIRGQNRDGVAVIQEREVSQDDVRRVLEQARAVPLPADRQVLHVLPQEYRVDDQDGIKEPLGMNGVRLEARVHMVTAGSSCIANIVKCAERCDLHVAELVLEPLASSLAILTDDEKEIGVGLIDIGGGTTDVILYSDGAVVHTASIPIGGLNLTNDIAQGLRTPMADAERAKIKYGCASVAMIESDETVQLPSVGGRPDRVLERQLLCGIIEPRVEEIFEACRHVIDESGYGEMLSSGIVLAGGSTLLEGTPELAESVLGLPVRRGVPGRVGGLLDVVRSPAYATAVGLVLYGAEAYRAAAAAPVEATPRQAAAAAGSGFGGRISAWFREVF